jgi:hypothetical protein
VSIEAGEEVDKERFVKLFLSGLKQAAGLSKSGLEVFEVVYKQIRENPNSDQVQLSFYRVSQHADLNDCTYQRGLRELLDKKFIFRGPRMARFSSISSTYIQRRQARVCGMVPID